MILLLLRIWAWVLTLALGCALTLAPLAHGINILAGRAPFDVSDLIIGPLAFVAGLGCLRLFGWLHEGGL